MNAGSLLLMQFDTLNITDDKDVRHQADQRGDTDVDQRIKEIPGSGDNKTDN